MVPIRSFLKIQVLYVIRIESHGTKNKNFKPHVPKEMCLTLKRMDAILKMGMLAEDHLGKKCR
jgi:hypothetical protein